MTCEGAPEAVEDPSQLATWATSATPIALIIHLWIFRSQSKGYGGLGVILALCLVTATFFWLGIVSRIVPEPYLDEIFHIPQAQRYCEGKFYEWDNKITTPPGLYWLSILIPEVAKRVGLISKYACDPRTLRSTSAIALIILSDLCLLCRREIEARLYEARTKIKTKDVSQYSTHTAFNIALFPLVFFFSGLYYTDVASTAVVLASYLVHLIRMRYDTSSLVSDVITIFLGIRGLAMRQTNVFWIVVYMGGLEAVHAVKTLRPKSVSQPFMATLSEQVTFFTKRYAEGHVHDPPLNAAYPEDMLFTILSLVVAAICNPVRVLRQIWPYIAVLLSFANFVYTNGGVVLGDKSNHVATIHLAQMLYLWAFIGFFSLPLFLPYAISILSSLRDISDRTRPEPRTTSGESSVVGESASPAQSGNNGSSGKREIKLNAAGAKTSPQLTFPLRQLAFVFNNRLLWPVYLLATVVLSGLIVRYNTIIHPFTLADNRHYMFYVFRYTIRRANWIRYVLVVPYTLSRWLVWGTLSGGLGWTFALYRGDQRASYLPAGPSSFINDPFMIAYGSQDGQPTEGTQEKKLEAEELSANDDLSMSTDVVPTSTGLILLLATALSLVTAPLVEPRYFIIPWVMWRLLVPAWRMQGRRPLNNPPDGSGVASAWGKLVTFAQGYDVRLILETLWFIAINLVTGYIFLYKPYVWRAEDGSVLDEGRLQRFMW